jgi:hypothetical protein
VSKSVPSSRKPEYFIKTVSPSFGFAPLDLEVITYFNPEVDLIASVFRVSK